MRITILSLLTIGLMGCATAEQKEAKTLNQSATNALTPPIFNEPSEALRSIYLVECPKCKAKQFLVPLKILVSGSSITTNGNVAERSLYFICSKRTCKNVILVYDQVPVEPVKAVRVR